jgi:hypothetical protein
VAVNSLCVGDKYYVNISGDTWDEFEILDIDPVGNMLYRNNSFRPERTLWCRYDSPLMERLVHRKIPPVQVSLFPEPSTSQIDLFQ